MKYKMHIPVSLKLRLTEDGGGGGGGVENIHSIVLHSFECFIGNYNGRIFFKTIFLNDFLK